LSSSDGEQQAGQPAEHRLHRHVPDRRLAAGLAMGQCWRGSLLSFAGASMTFLRFFDR